MKIQNWLYALCLAAVTLPAAAQVQVVKHGKAVARIVADPADSVDMRAAALLREFVGRISGAQLPVVANGEKPRRGDIVIDAGESRGLTEDGFRLRTDNGRLLISGGGGKGTIYGVVTLLEQYLGVAYYGNNAYRLTERAQVTIPEMNHAENPAFRFRQSQCYAMKEPFYRDWFRFEEPEETFAGGYWVHTFDRILPSDVYGKSHPEYYAFINGQRRPGKASQWCLTNPELFEVVCTKIDSIFRANPGMNTISVSQNDGNFTNCTCPRCRALDEREGGGPSGSLIHFLNRLADRFPDKEFSTLAYLYTMHPPRHVKPRPNVNIMLCDIDCKREVPLTDNASGRDFVQALEGWSAISDNLFVWDYGINFDNMLSPFPNFPILQKNIQLFRKNHVTMHFSQIGGERGSCFPEMRAYMVSKLMWNPDQDSDSLMRSFMRGYYGAAAPYVYQYEKLLEGGLLASNKELWIYDSPVTHKDGMLNAKCRKRYNELFDQAEAAVADDSVLLDRVRLSRLPLQYSELEIDRAEGVKDPEATMARLELFGERCRHFDIPILNERRNTPEEYCQLYRVRYMPDKNLKPDLARGAKVIWIEAPSPRYAKLGETSLTDGLFGGTTYVESWVGWEGRDGSFIIDLGQEREVSLVECDFLHQLGAWILLPERVACSLSCDNAAYEPFGEQHFAEDRSPQVKFVQASFRSDTPRRARYVRIDIIGTKNCPSWHYGVGHPSWFFLDEVSVR